MKNNIDALLDMLDCNNDMAIQQEGIELAKNIQYLSILFQPIEKKSIWKNCAKVIAEKTDKELEPYYIKMFVWLKDMNWPGAYLIYDRLSNIPFALLDFSYHYCLNIAVQTNDRTWNEVLIRFRKEHKETGSVC